MLLPRNMHFLFDLLNQERKVTEMTNSTNAQRLWGSYLLHGNVIHGFKIHPQRYSMSVYSMTPLVTVWGQFSISKFQHSVGQGRKILNLRAILATIIKEPISKKKGIETREIAQWLTTLAVLQRTWVQIPAPPPSVAHNSMLTPIPRDLISSFGPCRHLYIEHRHIYKPNSYKHKMN